MTFFLNQPVLSSLLLIIHGGPPIFLHILRASPVGGNLCCVNNNGLAGKRACEIVNNGVFIFYETSTVQIRIKDAVNGQSG
jgi:hypothetical protein